MIRFVTTLAHRYRHANWALVDQTMVSGANFATGVLLARFLGIEEYGRFVLAWMAIEIVRIVQDPLLTGSMTVIGPKQTEQTADLYYGTVLVSQLVLCFISSALLFAAVWLLNLAVPSWNLQGLPMIMSLAAFTCNLQYFLRRYAFSRQLPKWAFATDAVRYLGQLGILIVLFQMYELDARIALLVTGATSFFAALCMLPAVQPIKLDRGTFKRMVSRHWAYSKWLVPSALLGRASDELFFAVAGATIGAAAVGALKAARNLIGVTHVLMMGLGNFVPIRAAQRFSEDGKAGLTKFLRRFVLILSSGMGVIILIVVAAPEFWLGLVYGDQFTGQGHLVRWWGGLYFLISLSMPLSVGLRAIEYTRPLFMQNLALALFSIVICYPIIDQFGPLGVLFGMVFIQLVRLFVMFFSLTRRLRTEA